MFIRCLWGVWVIRRSKNGQKMVQSRKNLVLLFLGHTVLSIVLEFTIMPFMSSYVRGIIQILNKLVNENILNGNLDLIHLMKLRRMKICTVYNKKLDPVGSTVRYEVMKLCTG